MPSNGSAPLEPLRILERTEASMPALADLEGEVRKALGELRFPPEKLVDRQIAVTAGSRGIANLREIVKGVCGWLKAQGAHPFVIPAMGSHGGATGEGQQAILSDYGITHESVGAEIRSDMATVRLGQTSEGFQVYVDRNAWEADAIVALNRIKPHTNFSGAIESGLLKMITVGLGKRNGAQETHRWSKQFGYEQVIRAISAFTLSRGKILCGLGIVENEFHQTAVLRAARAEGLVAMEEATLPLARSLVPRLPISNLHLLVVDEMGKNVSGAGMDTKIIGRGVDLRPGEAPEIRQIYVRDLTAESEGNAIGVGLADTIHERLYRKVDLNKMYVNAQTSLSARSASLPMHFPSDRAALDFAVAAAGSPVPGEQRIVWIRNTLALNRIAVSTSFAEQVASLAGWQLGKGECSLQFDNRGNLASPLEDHLAP